MESLALYLLDFEFIRFVGIGGGGTALYYSIYTPIAYYKKERYVMAAVVAFAPSLVVTFTLQKYWTFANAQEDIVYLQLAFFLLQRAVMFVLNIYCLRLLVGKIRLHPFPGQVSAHALLAYPSYLLMRPIFAM